MRHAGGLLALALLTTGCEGFLTSFAAGSTIRVLGRGSAALQRFGDIELAEAAIPGSISTMEALQVIVPDSPVLRLTLARSYASYGFGFLVDHLESAQAADHEAEAEHYRARATAAFLRSRELAFGMLSIWEPDDGGIEGAVRRGPDAFRRYVAQFDQENQGGMLFWAAYSWVQYISLHRDDPNALADLPFVTVLAERAKTLDHTFNDYAPHALAGGLAGSAPAQVGGRPDIARQEFEAAIAATHRQNLMYMVLEARIVAVALQDRALYRRLLQEVIDAGDLSVDRRLNNLIAKRRAVRYLAEIESLFAPEEPAVPDAPPPPVD